MNEDELELYDIISEWWDEVFYNNEDKDTCIIDLTQSIVEWKDKLEYHEIKDPWNLRGRQPMEPVKKKQ